MILLKLVFRIYTVSIQALIFKDNRCTKSKLLISFSTALACNKLSKVRNPPNTETQPNRKSEQKRCLNVKKINFLIDYIYGPLSFKLILKKPFLSKSN